MELNQIPLKGGIEFENIVKNICHTILFYSCIVLKHSPRQTNAKANPNIRDIAAAITEDRHNGTFTSCNVHRNCYKLNLQSSFMHLLLLTPKQFDLPAYRKKHRQKLPPRQKKKTF